MTLLLFVVTGALFVTQLAGIAEVPVWAYVALAGLYALGRLRLRRTRRWFEFGDPGG